MSFLIRSAAVLGAGTMGAQIAGHLANAGIPVLLLDVTAEAARQGRDRLRTLKPDPLFQPDTAGLIRTAGFDELSAAATADWIIEAVVEDLVDQTGADRSPRAAPRARHDRVVQHVRHPACVDGRGRDASPSGGAGSARTSSIRRATCGWSRSFRLPDTDPAVIARLVEFIDHRLGKGSVVAKDTPGFIANRIGIFGALRLVGRVASGEFTIEEIDAITGPIIGRPKSATFRTLDIAGLDIFDRVAQRPGAAAARPTNAAVRNCLRSCAA